MQPPDTRTGTFVQNGEFWTVGCGSETVALRDVKGLSYIQRLLRYPGEEFHALDLSSEPGPAASPKSGKSGEKTSSLGDSAVNIGTLGDAGEMLDAKAKQNYRRRIEELREELEELDQPGNEDRADELKSEIDFLAREFARAIGLGGRDRRAGSAAERARLSVTRAIRTALEKISEQNPSLGELLNGSIKTGTFCSYRPRTPMSWQFAIANLAVGAEPGETTRFFAHREKSLLPAPEDRTTFVGRETERAEFGRCLEQAVHREGKVALLSGAPGVGKTRLAGEFGEEASSRGFLILVGSCYDRDDSIPFEPFVEVLEGAVAQASDPRAFRPILGEDASEIVRLMPQLGRLFPDIPPPPQLPTEQARRILFGALAAFFARIADSRPVLLVLEDLHWADEGTLSLLTHLGRSISRIPLLIVGTYRDDNLDPAGPLAKSIDDLIRLRIVNQMALGGLPKAAVGEMIRTLCGKEPPDALVSLILSYTEGNPFFIVELFRHLTESGKLFDSAGEFRSDLMPGDIGVPYSLRLVIGRRLARLSEGAQKALGPAAVIGRSFTFELLEAASHLDVDSLLDSVEEAEKAGLISSTIQYPDARFQFSHELIRQTVLAAISAPRLQRLNLDAADAIERLYVSTVEEHAIDIAHHLWQAGSVSDANRTVRYLAIAGKRTLDQSAYSAALSHLQKSLQLIPKLPESPERQRSELDIQLALGVAALVIKGWHAPEVGEAYKRARDLCQQLGDDNRLFWVLFGIWGFHLVRSEFRTARSYVAEMIELRTSAPEEKLAIAWALGSSQFLMGEFVDAHASFEECVRRYDRKKHRNLAQIIGQDPCVSAMSYDAMTLTCLGYADQAETVANKSVAFARELGHPFTLAFCLSGFGFYHWLQRNYSAAEKTFDESLALCRENNFSWFEQNCLRFWVAVMALQGKLELETSPKPLPTAANRNDDLLHLSRSCVSAGLAKSFGNAGKSAAAQNFMMESVRGSDFSQTLVSSALAECFGRVGKIDVAIALLQEAAALADRSEERYAEAEICRVRGDVELHRIDKSSCTPIEIQTAVSEAERSFIKAIEIARRQNAKMLEMRATIRLARLYQRDGRGARARSMLAEIYGWFTEGFKTPDLQEAQVLLAEL